VSVECNGRAAFGGFTAQLYLKTFVKCSCLIFGLDFGTIYLRRPLVCRRVAVHSEKAGVAAHFGVWGEKKNANKSENFLGGRSDLCDHLVFSPIRSASPDRIGVLNS
jgi:hypothetical protein